MVYNDFLSLLSRAINRDSKDDSFDVESFLHYEKQINQYLDNYFSFEVSEQHYKILQSRLKGYTLDEIGLQFQISRQRVNQILEKELDKLRDPAFIQENTNLRNLFSFLCGIGEAEIIGFIHFLVPKKHILLFVISDTLFKKSLDFEKQIKDSLKIRNKKPITKHKKLKHLLPRTISKKP